METYTISYFSKAKLSKNTDQLREEINSILTTAQRKNIEKNVTGALLFSGGYFVQILEGSLQSVEEIFESIQCDSRHTEVTVISNDYKAQRHFSKWAMALVDIQETAPEELKECFEQPDQLTESDFGNKIIAMFLNLLKSYENSIA